jgi:dipeptide transport system permease protein
MLAFVLKRLALVVPTFLGITLLVFSLIRLERLTALISARGIDEARGLGELASGFHIGKPLPFGLPVQAKFAK